MMSLLYKTYRTPSVKSNRKLGIIQLVRPTPGLTPCRGFLRLGSSVVGCVLGPAGAVWRKKEGDSATPRGLFSILFGRYRTDRVSRPASPQILKATRRNDIWCDDRTSFRYNRLGAAPVKYGHERLWLESGVYDIVLVLDYNYHPRRLGAGSAIFFHLTENFSPTAGCLAVRLVDMRKILYQISKSAKFKV